MQPGLVSDCLTLVPAWEIDMLCEKINNLGRWKGMRHCWLGAMAGTTIAFASRSKIVLMSDNDLSWETARCRH